MNRFARNLELLNLDERRFVEPAADIAAQTFRTFADKPDSAYYAAPGLTPEETWQRIVPELARVSVLAALEGRRDVRLDVDDVEHIHRAIFEPVFGPETDGFRGRRETVQYPLLLGTQAAPVLKTGFGSSYKQIRPRLNRALRDFDEATDILETQAVGTVKLAAAVRPAIQLYTRVIRIHPFGDGNGRTAWAVFSYAAQRCGFPPPILAPDDRTKVRARHRSSHRQAS